MLPATDGHEPPTDGETEARGKTTCRDPTVSRWQSWGLNASLALLPLPLPRPRPACPKRPHLCLEAGLRLAPPTDEAAVAVQQ